MDSGFLGADRVQRDPALLAFIKCHLTSFTRWNTLCVLAQAPGHWRDANVVARAIRTPTDAVRADLEALARECLVECQHGPEGPTYRLNPEDPSGRVVERLVDAARRNQRVRQIVVARVVTDGAVSQRPVSAVGTS